METSGSAIRLNKANPYLLFVTGRLAAPWLNDYLQAFATRFGFDYAVATLAIDVAAFMTCRYIADNLKLTEAQRLCTDMLILPGFAGGDLTKVEEAIGVPAVRGPSDLAELEGFLAELCQLDFPSKPMHYYTETQLRAMQSLITDPNIRIYSDGERIFAFNNAIFVSGGTADRDLRNIFRALKIENAAHAFYLGRELYKAAMSIYLKIPYKQDRDLPLPDAGIALPKEV